MRTVLVFLFLVFSSALLAQNVEKVAEPAVDTTGLTAEQAASVAAQVKALNDSVRQMKKSGQPTLEAIVGQMTPEKFRDWADAGQAAGKAVSNFTKEVGIGADAFLKTDTGKLAVLAVIWKAGGDQVAASAINVVLSVILAIVLFAAWWKLTRLFVFGQRIKKEVVYNQNTFLRWLGFNQKTISIQDDDRLGELESEHRAWLMFVSRLFSLSMLVVIVVTTWPTVQF